MAAARVVTCWTHRHTRGRMVAGTVIPPVWCHHPAGHEPRSARLIHRGGRGQGRAGPISLPKVDHQVTVRYVEGVHPPRQPPPEFVRHAVNVEMNETSFPPLM